MGSLTLPRTPKRMFISTFLVVSLALSVVSPALPKIKELGKSLDIVEINKDLNLHHGDMMEKRQRNTILDQDELWTSPVPYVLNNDLEMNAKGIILRAFDQFRLKSCIDFKPRDYEDYYISVQKLQGCFSYVGRIFSNGQNLSIGEYCDDISTVEHEFLHALGFYHEQSRTDRDDHVTIVYENIIEGRENNFEKLSAEEISTQGTPYDYNSVMHYSQYAFSNGNGSTIITKLPEFQDEIGQRLEMSSNDIVKLNRLYSCSSTIAFKEFCDFSDEDMCGMSRCTRGVEAGWERVTSSRGGPYTDHTNLTKTGFFMHASTVDGQEGDRARLESRIMTPSRKCSVQCLQFYYYHSGSESDQLNIWIREYQDEKDTKGTLRLMGQITGPPASYWQLHHVPLNATNTFQVEFEVRKGAGNSTGGFSIDDVNLSETECPHNTWQIRDFENVLNTSDYDTYLFSPKYYSRGGYAYQIVTKLFKTYFGIYVRLVSGDYDDQLQWPCPWRQVTFILLDQNPNIQLQMSKQRSITSDPNATDSDSIWGNPSVTGSVYTDENNETYHANTLIGTYYFGDLEGLQKRDFLKGGDVIILTTMQDISPLLQDSSLPCPMLPPVMFTLFPEGREGGPCVTRNITTTVPPPKTTLPPATSTLPPPTTTEDMSIFGFSPGMASSPVVVLLLALMLLLTH